MRQLHLLYSKLAEYAAKSSQYAGTGFLSVVDLLDVADVYIVQHITALRQDPGEGSDHVQHGNLLSTYSYLFNTGISYSVIMNGLCTFCEYMDPCVLKIFPGMELDFVSNAQKETFPISYNTEFGVIFCITI